MKEEGFHNRIRKPWITEEIVNKMEERRQEKKLNTQEGRKKCRRSNNENDWKI